MTLSVFVDTAAWLALVNKADSLHDRAKKERNNLVKHKAEFVLSDYVVLEVANALSKPPWRKAAVRLIESIRVSPNIRMIEVDQEILDEAWDLYRDRADKEWSLTDCTSFVVMERSGVKEAFTSDHHFEQAGFRILL